VRDDLARRRGKEAVLGYLGPDRVKYRSIVAAISRRVRPSTSGIVLCVFNTATAQCRVERKTAAAEQGNVGGHARQYGKTAVGHTAHKAAQVDATGDRR
jgi:hypothetical protein